MRLWDWAVEVHGGQGVDAALNHLQDAHGQCVSYLLWAAWAAAEGRVLSPDLLASGATLAARWETSATGPLRKARRELKPAIAPVPDDARLALREQVRRAEFAAERLLIDALEAAAPEPSRPPRDLGDAMTEASLSWTPPAPKALLRDLATRLRLG